MQLRARRGFNPGKGGFDQGCGDERCENPGTIPEKVDIFIYIYIYKPWKRSIVSWISSGTSSKKNSGSTINK
jgi:hypothetical protein